MKAKIYHKIDNKFFFFEEPPSVLEREEYKLVAEIDANDLDKIYAHTQNLSFNWAKNPLVTTNHKELRSTSVGDIIEVNGVLNLVENLKFKTVIWK